MKKVSGRDGVAVLDSYFLSLVPFAGTARITARSVSTLKYEEIINGRPYTIEVSPVSPGRWRAQIVRTPGGSSALMPFYGVSPDEAAEHLSAWLTRAAQLAPAGPAGAASR